MSGIIGLSGFWARTISGPTAAISLHEEKAENPSGSLLNIVSCKTQTPVQHKQAPAPPRED